MLTELHIANFALVDDLTLDFGGGFGVLTGETGAGKSIVVDAIGAALGERTGSDVVRTGAGKAIVEAVFDVSDCPSAEAAASELGFDCEDGLLILSREISRAGKSQLRVNGRITTGSMIRGITSRLIDIHGQHEHQSLLNVPIHVEILDAWCGEDAARLAEAARDTYHEMSTLAQERDRLQTDERERARMLDLYGFQLEEIKAANLQPSEEEALAQERSRLANAEKLYAAAEEVHSALAGDDGGAIDCLSKAALIAQRAAAVDPSMAELVENLNSALIAAQESLVLVRDYGDAIEANPQRLEQIEERLDLIRTLKRKYGDTTEDVLTYAQDLTQKLDTITHADERIQDLKAEIGVLEERLCTVSAELTRLRKNASVQLEKSVERELSELAMERTVFKVDIQPVEPGPNGADSVEFLISPNPGEPVKPLAKIASGGEMSRIMLALKTVTTRAEVPTLIFDEIDTGIGGRTAQALGDKLASLGSRCQVICVTHLPQIASKAAHHVVVSKKLEGGRTVVTLQPLEGEERVAELARMLGAEEGSTTAAQHAREMLALANQGNGKTR